MSSLLRPRSVWRLILLVLIASVFISIRALGGISVQLVAPSASPSTGVFLSDGTTRLHDGSTFDFGFFDVSAFNALSPSAQLDYAVLTNPLSGPFEVLGTSAFSGDGVFASHNLSEPGDPSVFDEQLYALIFDPTANEIGLFGYDGQIDADPPKFLWSLFPEPGIATLSTSQANQFILGSGPATPGSGPLLLTSAVPEPSTLLALLGIVGVVVATRRRFGQEGADR